MKEIRETKLVEQTTIKFVADDGKEFIGENAERDCRDYERTKNRKNVEDAFNRLDVTYIDNEFVNWFGEYSYTKVLLTCKADFVAMMDYFDVIWNVYDNDIQEPSEYPYTMMVASGCDWVGEYKKDLKAQLQKALEQLDK